MKKIIFIVSLMLIISGCSKSDHSIIFEGEYDYLNGEVSIPTDWSYKYGSYGEFYTDYENFILINTFDDIKSLESKIVSDINFYLPKYFSLNDEYNLEFYKNDEILLSKSGDVFNSTKGKIFESEDSKVYVIIGVKNEDEGKLYQKTIK